MEGADRFIFSPVRASWFGNIAGRGGGKDLDKVTVYLFGWINRMDSHFDRNIVFIRIRRLLFTGRVEVRE